jgi:quercetin dioxygenase-like cupin family protein
MKTLKIFFTLLICVAGLMLTSGVSAQGAKRTILEKQDLSIPGYEAVIANIEIEPGALAGRHTHPGEEILHVLNGEVEFYVEGSSARHLKSGQVLVIPAGKIHSAKNIGSRPFKATSVYVVEKNKPLATPVP